MVTADPVLPAQIRHKTTNLSLAQHRQDLAFRKTAFLHRILLSHIAEKILHTKPLNHGGITQDYNTIRPHSKLGGLTPAEIAGQRGWGHAPSPVAITSTISHQCRGLSV